VARWDGTNWSALGAGIAGTRVTALAVDSMGALYAGGEFTNAGGVAAANIAKWDGTSWSALGSGLSNDPYSSWVLALALRGTELFAGGFFTDAGGVNVSCIARWNGSAWSAVGGGLDDNNYLPQVTALAVKAICSSAAPSPRRATSARRTSRAGTARIGPRSTAAWAATSETSR
jgi:hypothetical protein